MPPQRPLLIYDGRCGFCGIWIRYWQQLTADRVAYATSQDVASEFPHIPAADFARGVQLIRADESVASGAEAVFETLGWQSAYRHVPLLAPVSEAAYGFIASHRDFAHQATRLTFGTDIQVERFASLQWVFLRLLAIVYAIAFASLAVQVRGLIGEQGIIPAGNFFSALLRVYGTDAYWAVPSVFWMNASDAILTAAAWSGVALALVAALGRIQRLAFLTLYVLYLSFSMASQVFLGFQWDSLLLEAGFLAIFFGHSASQTRKVAWLYRLLVFRLYFLSGWVKISSGDATWPNLSALDFHFHTQPLPTVLAWYADRLPRSVLHAATWGTLAIELALPFLIFGPRRWRQFAASLMLLLQLAILLTGNYAFFNLLTMALTLFLFDDLSLPAFARRGEHRDSSRRWQMAGSALVFALALLGACRLYETTRGNLPSPLRQIATAISPYQIANSYGLFAIMTTTRAEIVIEGSDDGETWKPFEFRYKPGDLNRAPAWVAPHQPRLDWQLWFAALGTAQENPWFEAFLSQILHNSPAVMDLISSNPFAPRAPVYIRATRYIYQFSPSGPAWWSRTSAGVYYPAVRLQP